MFNHPFAVLSDIHGNSWALKAVLEDIKRRGIPKILNLGDTLYGPLDPMGVFRLIMEGNIRSIQGNEDRILWNPSLVQINKQTLGFCKRRLNSKAMDWLKKLETTAIVNSEIFLCHGSLERDDEYLLEKVSSNGVLRELPRPKGRGFLRVRPTSRERGSFHFTVGCPIGSGIQLPDGVRSHAPGMSQKTLPLLEEGFLCHRGFRQ
ncbi:MAG: metallophosphoesterase family protein [Candidatus Heimdallarchaeota archaeon]